jgi:hypothetical protein
MTIAISVSGARISPADWGAAQALPREQIPPLTPEQKQAARELGIPEEDYARGAVASEKGAERDMWKAERFARLIHKELTALKPDAQIESVRLDGLHGSFEIEMRLNGRRMPFQVSEKLVDELFESGSPEAERRLKRVLELAVGAAE